MAETSPAPGVAARRGRPPQISAEDILAVVANRVDGQWSVTSVAAELGVSDAAIYRYFPSKKAILAAVLERVMADHPVPVYAGDWRALLTELGRSSYELFVRFPSFLDLDAWAGVTSTSSYTSLEKTLSELLRAGFSEADALAVMGALGSVAREYARTVVIAKRVDVSAGRVWDTASAPTLARVVASVADMDPDELFEQALTVVIDGAGQRLPRAKRRTTAR